MKYINTLIVQIVVAVTIGLLFAAAFTTITYNCAPIEGALGCVSYDKAVMHLGDLLSNKQDSLQRFFTTFAITTLVVFAILRIFSLTKKSKT